MLIVADNGIGIASGHLKQITEPFKQVENSTQCQYGSVGLGLHLVSRSANMHSATLDIQSEFGDGTKITVRFSRERVAGFENVVQIADDYLSTGDD